jgi:hypothetical protein
MKSSSRASGLGSGRRTNDDTADMALTRDCLRVKSVAKGLARGSLDFSRIQQAKETSPIDPVRSPAPLCVVLLRHVNTVVVAALPSHSGLVFTVLILVFVMFVNSVFVLNFLFLLSYSFCFPCLLFSTLPCSPSFPLLCNSSWSRFAFSYSHISMYVPCRVNHRLLLFVMLFVLVRFQYTTSSNDTLPLYHASTHSTDLRTSNTLVDSILDMPHTSLNMSLTCHCYVIF